MAKWYSVLFSDIRNKLGDQVVFSNWKGRGYIRTYTKPANPNTLKQQANRDHQNKLVKRWQGIVTTSDIKAAWNEEGRPQELPGYNIFIKYGRKSKISCPATASGSGSATITITYTLGFAAAKARIFRENVSSGTLVDITPAEGLSEDPDSTITDTITTSGTYRYWIACGDVLVPGDTAPQPYQAINAWEPDYSAGIAKEAKCEVTIS